MRFVWLLVASIIVGIGGAALFWWVTENHWLLPAILSAIAVPSLFALLSRVAMRNEEPTPRLALSFILFCVCGVVEVIAMRIGVILYLLKMMTN